MAPNYAVLVDVKYVPEKRQIVAEFSSEKGKISKRFKFHPLGFLNCSQKEKAILEGILSHYNPQRVSLNFPTEGTARITAATFSDLKKIANLISLSSGKIMNVIEPERQFLLGRNWHYYEKFLFFHNQIEKTGEIEIPDIETDFTTAPLAKFIEQSLSKNLIAADSLLERLASSHLLSIPLTDHSQDPFFRGELFLENIFFQNQLPVPKKDKPELQHEVKRSVKGMFKFLTEIDFANVWPSLFTYPNMNLGFENINCSCCKPDNFYSKNLSPASMLEVKFLRHEFYFESVNKTWSAESHTSYPGRKKRMEKMEEWKLCSMPVGPFSIAHAALLPLPDALKLKQQGIVKINEQNHKLQWFCNIAESTLSKSINSLQSKITRLNDSIQKKENNAIELNGLLGGDVLSREIQYQFELGCHNSTLELLHYLPLHLTNSNSKFYQHIISQSISTKQAEVMAKFKEFLEEKGAKFVASNHYLTLIEADSVLSIVKEFSNSLEIPQPKINTRHEEVLLG